MAFVILANGMCVAATRRSGSPSRTAEIRKSCFQTQARRCSGSSLRIQQRRPSCKTSPSTRFARHLLIYLITHPSHPLTIPFTAPIDAEDTAAANLAWLAAPPSGVAATPAAPLRDAEPVLAGPGGAPGTDDARADELAVCDTEQHHAQPEPCARECRQSRVCRKFLRSATREATSRVVFGLRSSLHFPTNRRRRVLQVSCGCVSHRRLSSPSSRIIYCSCLPFSFSTLHTFLTNV